jgi:hypothetical protein
VKSEHWKSEPEEHDYPAAVNYLSLLLGPESAQSLVEVLRSAPTEFRKAKDLLRASDLELLKEDNKHVASDLAKVKQGEELSPVLLVRGNLDRHQPLTVADGYHRICASYHIDENTDIPCRIVDLHT